MNPVAEAEAEADAIKGESSVVELTTFTVTVVSNLNHPLIGHTTYMQHNVDLSSDIFTEDAGLSFCIWVSIHSRLRFTILDDSNPSYVCFVLRGGCPKSGWIWGHCWETSPSCPKCFVLLVVCPVLRICPGDSLLGLPQALLTFEIIPRTVRSNPSERSEVSQAVGVALFTAANFRSSNKNELVPHPSSYRSAVTGRWSCGEREDRYLDMVWS